MGERTSYEPGCFCWIDLKSPDIDKARQFYEDVFGWSSHVDGDDHPYVHFQYKGGDVGGGFGAPGPAAWNTYVSVADVEASLAKAVELGATPAMPPTDTEGAGRMAVFIDPSGAALALWQPQKHCGSTIVNEPGTWTWTELMTRDVDAVLPFYAELFGWTYEDPNPDNDYRVIQLGGRQIGGIMPMPEAVPAEAPSAWETYFNVADLDDTMAKIKDGGGILPMDVMEIPDIGRFVVAHDPTGASFIALQAINWDD